MDTQSQIKVMDAGFRIIRKDDYPQPRIKAKTDGSEWRTLEKYSTKAARDRAFVEMMKDLMTISD